MNMYETLKTWEIKNNYENVIIKLYKELDYYLVEVMRFADLYNNSEIRKYKSRNAAMNYIRKLL